jgi:polysaccharide deacetylase family protein (PEP-CTERM system associated)
MLNALSIDLEDYFQVHAFSNVISFKDWDKFESHVERNTNRLLDILRTAKSPHSDIDQLPCLPGSRPQGGIKATFFCLGWVAERYPNLIKRIQQEGHEIACHGYAHKLIYDQSPKEFRNDVRRAKDILEGIIGCKVIGYRAPTYSITANSLWAMKILAEEGFKYDSSIFPVSHDFYGMPGAPRSPFLIFPDGNSSVEMRELNLHLSSSNADQRESQILLKTSHEGDNDCKAGIIEFPLSTVKILGKNIPVAGGGYFRLFPLGFSRKALTRINQKEKRFFIFYLHPWEIDYDQPRIKGVGLKSRFRHYVNLSSTEKKFKLLLEIFPFTSFKSILNFNIT